MAGDSQEGVLNLGSQGLVTHASPSLERDGTLTVTKVIPSRHVSFRGARARTKGTGCQMNWHTWHYRYCVQIKNRLQTCLLEQPISWCAEPLHTSSSTPMLLSSVSCAPSWPLRPPYPSAFFGCQLFTSCLHGTLQATPLSTPRVSAQGGCDRVRARHRG